MLHQGVFGSYFLMSVGDVLIDECQGLLPAVELDTAIQIALAALALLLAGFGLSAPVLLDAMIWGVAATTFASGVAYVVQAARRTAGWTT